MYVDWPCVSLAASGDPAALATIIAQATHHDVLGQRLFAQACPHDESIRPDLSFAGVYRTYHPRRDQSQGENIAAGLAEVIAGRNNPYASIYYRRHDIDSDRPVDVKFAGFVDRILGVGTAYVHGSRCLLQYFDSYLSLYVNDPVRIYAERGRVGRTGADARLTEKIFEVGELLDLPLDIEFVITAENLVYVTQVRPISAAHLGLWGRVSDAAWAELGRVGPPSICLNSIGRYEGPLVDLRHRPPVDADAARQGTIYVVHHHAPQMSGTGALRFLEWAAERHLFGFGLLVDHGERRRNDHLDYILAEDPGVRFVAAATGLPERFTCPGLTLDSDGFGLSWR